MSTCQIKQRAATSSGRGEIPRYTSGPASHLAKTNHHQTKAIKPQTTKPILDQWLQIPAITQK